MQKFILFCEAKPDYYFFQQNIISHVRQAESNWMAVFPVNRAVRIFTRKLIPHAPQKILAAPHISTFDNLLLKLYQAQAQSKTVINNELQIFLVEEVLKKLSAEFLFLPNKSNPPQRLVQKVTRMISELRRFGYTGKELATREAGELNIDPQKLDDFKLILNQLEKFLGERYIDLPAARQYAALNLDESIFRKIFPKIENIYISGYGLFTPAMYLFLEKVISFCNVYIKLEFHKENLALFENTRPAFERLAAMGAQIVESDKHDQLADKLFNRERKVGTFNATDKISAVLCDNTEDEIVTIARQIHKLYNEQNIPLDKIAVTFNPLEKYVPAISRIFTEFGIPYNISTGYPLKQSPLTAALISVIDVVNENFEYNKIFTLYQSPFFKSGYNYLAVILYKALVKGRIKYLVKNWDEKLLNNLQSKGERISDNLHVQIKKLKLFLDAFKTFGNHNRTASRFKTDYLTLLKNSSLSEWYKRDSAQMQEIHREREFRAFNKFMKILDQFCWSVQIVFGDQEIELKTWLQHLKAAVNRSVFNLTEWPLEAVQVMPRLEIQAIDYDVLFLGGLSEGVFPRPSAADIFLSDENRQKLGLLANEDLLSQDRFIFYNLLSYANKKVYLSTPHYSGEKTLVPSSFISDLKECCTIGEFKKDDTPVYSIPQLWESLGQAIRKKETTAGKQIINTISAIDSGNALNNLFHKASAQHGRLSFFEKPGLFEGNLQNNAHIKNIVAEKFKERSWSITQLEDYAFCPMQYFLKRFLYLEELPEYEEDINPLERGNILHNILFRFYNTLRNNNALNNPHRHQDLLNKICEEELNKMPFEGFFWQLEKMRYFGRADYPGLLQKFLELEKTEIEQTGFIPAYFEYSFGAVYSKETDPASTDNLLSITDGEGKSIQINGKIDRIDINPKTGQALVYDYKTGSIDGKNAQAVAKGMSFQLPVYILAVEQLLDKKVHVVYGGYYQVKDAQNCKRVPAMLDPEKYPFVKKGSRAALPNNYVKINGEKVSFTELLEFSKNTALNKKMELLQARFNHTKDPDDKRCSNFCDYKRMCQKYVSKLKYQASL
jgi:ATP-dependent helicase/nuclease subunit B